MSFNGEEWHCDHCGAQLEPENHVTFRQDATIDSCLNNRCLGAFGFYAAPAEAQDANGQVHKTLRVMRCPTAPQGVLGLTHDLRIFTAGYGYNTPETLRVAAERLNALVLDIRYSPFSTRREWGRERLERLLGARYEWLPALGNKNHRNRELGVEIADLPLGLQRVTSAKQPVILLCACVKREGCHRAVVAAALEEQGYSVSELEWPRLNRLAGT